MEIGLLMPNHVEPSYSQWQGPAPPERVGAARASGRHLCKVDVVHCGVRGARLTLALALIPTLTLTP